MTNLSVQFSQAAPLGCPICWEVRPHGETIVTLTGSPACGHEHLDATMPLEKGSATVPVALFGVPTNSWCSRFHSPFGASRRVLPARRRDTDGSSRETTALPISQLHRSGSGAANGVFAIGLGRVAPSAAVCLRATVFGARARRTTAGAAALSHS